MDIKAVAMCYSSLSLKENHMEHHKKKKKKKCLTGGMAAGDEIL
jgi:hypothetical protein